MNVESCLRKKHSRGSPETFFGAPVRDLMRPAFSYTVQRRLRFPNSENCVFQFPIEEAFSRFLTVQSYVRGSEKRFHDL